MQGLNFIFSLAVLIISVVIHEVSHGYAAYLLGDTTAKKAGRLSMNPLTHLDLTGSFVVPLMMVLFRSPFVFGWAKPVPYNPYNLKNQKWGPCVVAVAGPLSNFIVAGFFGAVSLSLPLDHEFKTGVITSSIGNSGALSGSYTVAFFYFSAMVAWINVFLGVFNLIPIPPLDGSKVLFSFFPYRWNHIQLFLERYGFFILIFFIFYFSQILSPVVSFLFKLFFWL